MSKADQARVTLDSLGERRARLKADEETLREDTRTGLRRRADSCRSPKRPSGPG
jgi:hypothetical protein